VTIMLKFGKINMAKDMDGEAMTIIGKCIDDLYHIYDDKNQNHQAVFAS